MSSVPPSPTVAATADPPGSTKAISPSLTVRFAGASPYAEVPEFGDQTTMPVETVTPGPVVPFATLLDDLLAEARQRPTHAYTAAGADATVLRSAGSIAGKLG